MRREDLSAHLAVCKFRPDDRVPISPVEVDSDYEVMCPYAFLGCQHSCSRNDVEEHIKECKYRYDKRPKSRGGSVHSTTHPPPPTMRERYSMMLLQLSLEILNFASDCKQSEELLHGIVQAALHVVQEASSTDEHLVDTKVCLFGSRAMELALPESDIDIVVDFMNGKRSDAESLRLVASNLEVGNWLEWIKFIDTATVPVIKLCTCRSSCYIFTALIYITTHTGTWSDQLLRKTRDDLAQITAEERKRVCEMQVELQQCMEKIVSSHGFDVESTDRMAIVAKELGQLQRKVLYRCNRSNRNRRRR